MTIEENLTVAIRVATEYRLRIWEKFLKEHQNHATFRAMSCPMTLQYGFSCACSGVREDFNITVRTLAQTLPEARDFFFRRFRAVEGRGRKKVKKDAKLALMRSKALLHRYLTAEQRRELKGTKSLTLQAQDGRTYLLKAGLIDLLGEDSKPTHHLCVVAKGHGRIPVYDLMLSHKLMLECSPEDLWKIAVVTKVSDRELVLNGPPPPLNPIEVIPVEVLDNPVEWVEQRLQCVET
jgi:hypothetical protein